MYLLYDDVFSLKVVTTMKIGQKCPRNIGQFALPFEFQIQGLTCNPRTGSKNGGKWVWKAEDKMYLLEVTV